MKIDIDKEADAAYIYVKSHIGAGEVAKTIEVNGDIILDFDEEGKLIGIEILNASQNLTKDFLSSVVRTG